MQLTVTMLVTGKIVILKMLDYVLCVNTSNHKNMHCDLTVGYDGCTVCFKYVAEMLNNALCEVNIPEKKKNCGIIF